MYSYKPVPYVPKLVRNVRVSCASNNIQQKAQETLSFAAKPVTDILERIDARLEKIERAVTKKAETDPKPQDSSQKP